MRVIICGAGQVGRSIAAYLEREDNDITVIDTKIELINHIREEMDVNAVLGHASDPNILSQAGMNEADMIIAVTHSDEVNMVACQVAHSLFGVPKKIARIRRQSYLEPAWSNLFSRAHMPIDVIISPEIEVAQAIDQRLLAPGTTNVISLADGRIQLAGVVCGSGCPVLNTQIRQFEQLFPDLYIRIGLISRKGQAFVPGPDDQIIEGDEVFYFTETRHMRRAMAIFGHEEKTARNIVMVGGGNIGLYLARMLLNHKIKTSLKIIEFNEKRARFLAEHLPNVTVLHGDGLTQELQKEAGMADAETMIAVTNDDETNILGALLARQNGAERTIALVNKPNFSALLPHLDIDVIVSPRASTVSKIMQNVRRGRIKALHSLLDGTAEIIEAEVTDTSSLANKAIHSLDLPRGVILGGVMNERREIVEMDDQNIIRPGDRVMLLALQSQARKVEKMFSVQVDLF